MAGLAGIAGFGLLIGRSAQAIDTLGKLSKRLGISTKALAEYQYMAGIAGMSVETANMSLQRFQRKIAEAATGDVPEMTKVFAQLGVQVLDFAGNTRSASAVLEDVADAFVNSTDKAERLRLAVKLFDSEGAAMVQILADGSDAMKEMAKEAVEFGLVLGVNQVKAVEASNDAIYRLTSRFKGFTRQLTAALAPAIKVITDMMGGWLDSFRGDKSMNEWAVSAANSVIEFARKASMSFIRLRSQIKLLWAEFGGLELLKAGKLQIELLVPPVLKEFSNNINKMVVAFENLDMSLKMFAVYIITGLAALKLALGILSEKALSVVKTGLKGAVVPGSKGISKSKVGGSGGIPGYGANQRPKNVIKTFFKDLLKDIKATLKSINWKKGIAKLGVGTSALFWPGSLNEGEDAMFEPGGQYYNQNQSKNDSFFKDTEFEARPYDQLPKSSPANEAMRTIRLAAEAETALLEEKTAINKFFDSLITAPQILDVGPLEGAMTKDTKALDDYVKLQKESERLAKELAKESLWPTFNSSELMAMAEMEVELGKMETMWENTFISMGNGMKRYTDGIKTEMEMVADNVATAFRKMEDAVFDFVTTGKLNFKDLFRSIAEDFLRSGIRSVMNNMFTKGSAGGDNPLSSWLGFAHGGRPPLNRPSIVGEQGPEIFVPRGAGEIIPNGGYGGQTANISFNINSLDPTTAADVIVSNRRVIEGVIAQAFNSRGRVGFA